MPVAPINLVPALVSSVVAWRVYRRVRRNIGPQPFQPKRLIAQTAVFAVACVALLFFVVQHLPSMFAFGGGLVSGTLLALVGLRFTKFDSTETGRFYTPNTYIGVGLSLLLIGRVVYRLMMLRSASANFDPAHAPFMKSPLTFFIFGLLAGYYLVYFPGVFIRCRELPPPPA